MEGVKLGAELVGTASKDYLMRKVDLKSSQSGS